VSVAKPYDVAGKELLQADPAAWTEFLGVPRPPERVELADTDLATISAAADKVLLIKDDPHWLMNVEILSSCEPEAPRQLLAYSGLLQRRHGLAVASVLVVLAPKAESPAYSGAYEVRPPFGPAWDFRYTVIRLWKLPYEKILTGPLSLLSLAPMADVPRERLPEVGREIGRRLKSEAAFANAERIVTMISVLMRLRYDTMTTQELLKSIPDIEEYPGFKMFLDRGRAEGREEGREEGRLQQARETLLKLGRKRYGPPTGAQEASLQSIGDIERLESLEERLFDAKTWTELLGDN
jgi:predicted transposase YdaD